MSSAVLQATWLTHGSGAHQDLVPVEKAFMTVPIGASVEQVIHGASLPAGFGDGVVTGTAQVSSGHQLTSFLLQL